MDYAEIITRAAGKMRGKARVRGMHMMVMGVLECLASGMSLEEILRDFPYLTEQDIFACLACAADRERR